MSGAGYSGTPLPQKLGIKPDHTVVLHNAPAGFAEDTLGELPAGAQLVGGLDGEFALADVIVSFHAERRDLVATLPAAHEAIEQAGAIWVAWPKKASKVPTDITEDIVREVALPRGLVDNKVCAIDETWSGLRLVIRKELRR